MIVKVQAAIVSTEGPKRVLIYDKTHDHHWEGEASEIYDKIQTWYKAGFITSPKVYFEAHLEDNKIMLDVVLEDQDLIW